MSIAYQKARLLGRMFRGGYEGEGTDLSGGYDGSEPGSGWGGAVAGKSKPGESAMAHAAAQTGFQRSDQQLADAGIAINGLNPVNSGQTEEQMGMAKSAGNFLGFAAPALAGVAVPGFGGIMGLAKTANNVINNGMSLKEAAGQYVGGQINGFANKATGGILGNAQMALSAAKSLGADVPSLNIGKEVVGALGMGPSGKSYGGAQQAQGATSAGDYVAMGIDSEGWTKREGVTT